MNTESLPPGCRPGSLENCRVALTRPEERNAQLERLIAAAGGTTIPFPAFKIIPLQATAPAAAYHWLIFVSPSAVEHGLAQCPTGGDSRLVAVGKGTARLLQDRARCPVLSPDDGADSEALLGLEEFSAERIRGRRVLIVRGQGGRELLADTLRARGAEVDYLQVYARRRPDGSLTRLRAASPHVVLISSSGAVDNLLAMGDAEQQAWLRHTPALCIHPRIAERARERGFRQLLTTPSPDAAAVAGHLCQWWQGLAETQGNPLQ